VTALTYNGQRFGIVECNAKYKRPHPLYYPAFEVMYPIFTIGNVNN
jgi:hypothetical protein